MTDEDVAVLLIELRSQRETTNTSDAFVVFKRNPQGDWYSQGESSFFSAETTAREWSANFAHEVFVLPSNANGPLTLDKTTGKLEHIRAMLSKAGLSKLKEGARVYLDGDRNNWFTITSKAVEQIILSDNKSTLTFTGAEEIEEFRKRCSIL